MRFSSFAYMAIPAMALASPPVHNLDPAHQRRAVEEAAAAAPAFAASSAGTIPIATASPTQISKEQAEENNILELRQAAGNDNLGATLTQATQAGTVTSQWVQTNADAAQSWSLEIYTQTFASPITQELTAGAGSIGLGTHTGTVGVVKVKDSAGNRVLPVGTMATAALGVVGVVAGMGLMVL